jgi:hypothetical protein
VSVSAAAEPGGAAGSAHSGRRLREAGLTLSFVATIALIEAAWAGLLGYLFWRFVLPLLIG